MANSDNTTLNTNLRRYMQKRVLVIAFFWTVVYGIFFSLPLLFTDDFHLQAFFLRLVLIFLFSLLMAYLFVFRLQDSFIDYSPRSGFLAKTAVVILASLLMNFFVNFVDKVISGGWSFETGWRVFLHTFGDVPWLVSRTVYWFALLTFTQLYLQINDKYNPGVFLDLIAGKYKKPVVEKKIVMFMDLKDSTSIAEKLGHEKYFLFIREFIRQLSLALFENGGTIYQYVGDEIVVSWNCSLNNTKNALNGIVASRRNIQKRSEYFRDAFGTVPEFRVGIHAGDVTIGEIGVIKKDLAMSGDTMNTTARIRSECTALNQKFIVSREFVEASGLKDFQTEYLGNFELKGKAQGVDLYALKI